MANRFAKKLPDAFRKDAESNNHKLLQLESDSLDWLDEDLQALRSGLSVDSAKSGTLDIFGAMVDLPRAGLDDELYRYAVSLKLAQNTTGAGYDDTVDILVRVLKCEKEDISIVDSDKPCKVFIAKLPYSVLKQSGLTTRQFANMVEGILPVCVTLDNGNFEGTFEFGETATEYDVNTGFADLEGTIGGFFGLTLGEDDVQN